MDQTEALLAAAIEGDRRSLARLLSVIEAGGAEFRTIAPKVFAAGRGIHSIGLTGAPGAGKSSLTDALVAEVRRTGSRVAVVAVDPSSPLSGGAILGDRVRLREQHTADDDVYVRSLASRGQLGGLSLAVPEMVRALDAAGWPVVLIETVGVGQSEVSIAENADTTVVVVNPGWGDEVQANKAGLLEIADVLIVNKADRPGVDSTVRDLERMLHLGKVRQWSPVVLTTVATVGTGVDELWSTISAHHAFLVETGELERRRTQRRLAEVRERVLHDISAAALRAERSPAGEQIVAELAAGDLDPVTASDRLAQLM
jgi:LAO/AO transport system kinase